MKLEQKEFENRRDMKILSCTRKRKPKKLWNKPSEKAIEENVVPSYDVLSTIDLKRKDRWESVRLKDSLKSKRIDEYNKHTTFVSRENDFVSYTTSLQEKQNIDVVVVPDINIKSPN